MNADDKLKQNSGGLSDSTFDELEDPFANWPPRPSNSSSSMGSAANKPTSSHAASGPSTNNFGFLSNNTPIGLSKPHQGSLVSDTNKSTGANMNMQAIGVSNQGNSLSITNSKSILGMGYANASSNAKRASDLGSIFASTNSGPTPRLAPPPATAIGRGAAPSGRGRGRNQAPRSSHGEVSTKQPPLLDLL